MEEVKEIDYPKFIEEIILNNLNEEVFVFTNKDNIDHIDMISDYIYRKDINVYILIIYYNTEDIKELIAKLKFRYRKLLSKFNVSLYIIENCLYRVVTLDSTYIIGDKFGQLVMNNSYPNFDEEIQKEIRDTIHMYFSYKDIIKIDKL